MNEKREESLREQLKEMVLTLSEDETLELLAFIRDLKTERAKEGVQNG